jgi:hypothetical protein
MQITVRVANGDEALTEVAVRFRCAFVDVDVREDGLELGRRRFDLRLVRVTPRARGERRERAFEALRRGKLLLQLARLTGSRRDVRSRNQAGCNPKNRQ